MRPKDSLDENRNQIEKAEDGKDRTDISGEFEGSVGEGHDTVQSQLDHFL